MPRPSGHGAAGCQSHWHAPVGSASAHQQRSPGAHSSTNAMWALDLTPPKSDFFARPAVRISLRRFRSIYGLIWRPEAGHVAGAAHVSTDRDWHCRTEAGWVRRPDQAGPGRMARLGCVPPRLPAPTQADEQPRFIRTRVPPSPGREPTSETARLPPGWIRRVPGAMHTCSQLSPAWARASSAFRCRSSARHKADAVVAAAQRHTEGTATRGSRSPVAPGVWPHGASVLVDSRGGRDRHGHCGSSQTARTSMRAVVLAA
jgi:hypothetical protein